MIETLALVRLGDRWPHAAGHVFRCPICWAPFRSGLIFGWLAGAGDIRKIGSGNIGATNVLRTGKRWAAAATLFATPARRLPRCWLRARISASQLFPVLAGFGAFLGHLYPVWLRFKGGKGVATFIGICWRWPCRSGF